MKCPVINCKNQREDWQVCCAKHWNALPVETQEKIWRLFKTEKGSVKHRTACYKAVYWLCRKEKGQ